MNIKVLSLLLAVQLALGVAIWLPKQLGEEEPAGFIQIDIDSIQSVRIADAEQSLAVTRNEDAAAKMEWLLTRKLPANAGKVRDVINTIIEAAKSNWPVATTEAARARFEVAEDNYQRSLSFIDNQGEPMMELYLGTSPGFGQVHARLKNGDAVYAIAFTHRQASLDKSDWLDKALLKPMGELTSVTEQGNPNWTLHKTDKGWVTSDAITPDQGLAEDLLGRFRNLNVLKLSDNPSPSLPAALSFALVDAGGKYDLHLFKTDADGNLIVKSSRYEAVFEIGGYLLELFNQSLTALKKQPSTSTDGS